MAAATGFTIDDFEKLSDEEAHYKELVDEELIDVSGNEVRLFSHDPLQAGVSSATRNSIYFEDGVFNPARLGRFQCSAPRSF